MKSERISPFWGNGYQPFSAIEYIDNTFNGELSISFKKKICCSATGEHKEVSYNSIPDYYSNCIECELNMICTMVLKRYNVLCISNNYSYLDTE